MPLFERHGSNWQIQFEFEITRQPKMLWPICFSMVFDRIRLCPLGIPMVVDGQSCAPLVWHSRTPWSLAPITPWRKSLRFAYRGPEISSFSPWGYNPMENYMILILLIFKASAHRVWRGTPSAFHAAGLRPAALKLK